MAQRKVDSKHMEYLAEAKGQLCYIFLYFKRINFSKQPAVTVCSDFTRLLKFSIDVRHPV